ncbi:MAG: SDR family NAD(P)-dependent oxidoreductase [Promethearchaeota archaeon]
MIIENKKILVTGVAVGGIGEAIMRKLSNQNNEVLISSLNMINDRFPGINNIAADCTTEEGIRKVKKWVQTKIGSIDILINNIGGSLASKNPLEVDASFFNRVINVNLTSAFLLTRMAAELMIEGGAIVHIVSSAAYEPSLDKMPYGVAKAGLVYLIRTMARVLAPKIRINGVSPTYVFTDRHNRELEKKSMDNGTTIEVLSSKLISKQLLNYPLLPKDLNEMIEFAATTPLMTGKILDASLGRIF